ncbi:hypothetical protein M409DRAFT_64388 [Zasmidium cellare ATCC 36951]|uniref:Major facilitator superfamily (MFS) profile domain-containing protein n=1 Tax=Zasmidium cellare ATCC 36951 TaxID=1080233 RepID=A0A6A6CUX9_ZASCE|nr:uncharacterized protein M409DRAFT_64388 [Zasmidium cellare ATCC 36951]KAF2170000.1 hypothetical protein M409DRAFT_64388 [Zasmidium cellare ATCC 36951]
MEQGQQGYPPELIRRSTIESYVDDPDEDEDHGVTRHSSLSLFHSGYREEPYWERQLQNILPAPARVPSRKYNVPSRQATLLQTTATEPPKDINLVTWDDKDDPLNPHNWPAHRRWTSTVLIALFAFIAPMASTMVAPALEVISDDFNIESDIEEFLVMSIFLLAFAIGPFLWGPLSEVFGRVRVMQGANMIFLIFNTACGFAKNKHQMMAFRFLSGIGGSAPQAIGGGILSDCFKAGERGLATAIYSLMPFLSPATAPIMGGYMTQYITWRWVFWATSIFDLAVQLKILMKALIRPFIMLTTQPALQAMALFRGYQYGLMYLVFATFPMVFEEAYDMEVGRASLNYLSLGIGFIVGLQISGLMQDKIYTWCKVHEVDPSSLRNTLQSWKTFRKGNDATTGRDSLLPLSTTPHSPHTIPRKPVPPRTTPGGLPRRTTTTLDDTKSLPEYRLPLVLPFSLLIPLGIFIYGWSAQTRTHWIVPNIGCAILAVGLIVCFNCAQGYVVDTYTTYAASATGAAAFVRTMCGFSFPLFAPGMYEKLGVGWGNSLLGFVSLSLGMVAPVLLWRYGPWLRGRNTYCVG